MVVKKQKQPLMRWRVVNNRTMAEGRRSLLLERAKAKIKALEQGWKRGVYSTGGVFYSKKIGDTEITISLHRSYEYGKKGLKSKKYYALFGSAPYGLTVTEKDKNGNYAFVGTTEERAFKSALRAVKDYFKYKLKYTSSF